VPGNYFKCQPEIFQNTIIQCTNFKVSTSYKTDLTQYQHPQEMFQTRLETTTKETKTRGKHFTDNTTANKNKIQHPTIKNTKPKPNTTLQKTPEKRCNTLAIKQPPPPPPREITYPICSSKPSKRFSIESSLRITSLWNCRSCPLVLDSFSASFFSLVS